MTRHSGTLLSVVAAGPGENGYCGGFNGKLGNSPGVGRTAMLFAALI